MNTKPQSFALNSRKSTNNNLRRILMFFLGLVVILICSGVINHMYANYKKIEKIYGVNYQESFIEYESGLITILSIPILGGLLSILSSLLAFQYLKDEYISVDGDTLLGRIRKEPFTIPGYGVAAINIFLSLIPLKYREFSINLKDLKSLKLGITEFDIIDNSGENYHIDFSNLKHSEIRRLKNLITQYEKNITPQP